MMLVDVAGASVADIIGTGIAIIGFLSALTVTVYRGMRRLESLVGTDPAGRSIADRLDKVERQVFPNGGSSIADQMRRTEHLARETAAEVRVVRDMLGTAIHHNISNGPRP